MSVKQDHKRWRISFNGESMERDGHCCAMCGRKAGAQYINGVLVVVRLDVHHITDRHEMPNGGYAKENGITLCDWDGEILAAKPCHGKAEVYHQSKHQRCYSGFAPEQLYAKIGSSYEQALKASEALR